MSLDADWPHCQVKFTIIRGKSVSGLGVRVPRFQIAALSKL